MNKKTIAYILIGAGVLAAIYFIYTKMRDSAAAGALGAGAPDTRGAYAVDDDAAYNKMRNAVMAHKDKYDGAAALGWIDPFVMDEYTTGPTTTFHSLKGQPTKAGAFLRVFEAVNPNVDGKFQCTDNSKCLFPESLHNTLYVEFNKLKVKHGGL